VAETTAVCVAQPAQGFGGFTGLGAGDQSPEWVPLAGAIPFGAERDESPRPHHVTGMTMDDSVSELLAKAKRAKAMAGSACSATLGQIARGPPCRHRRPPLP
jgi:hypothetical protein